MYFPKVLAGSPMCSPSHSILSHLYLKITFLFDSVCILGGNQDIPDGIVCFEMFSYPMFAVDVLKAFT